MNHSTTRRLAYGGLMAALIALLTAYVRLDILFFLSMHSGYAHLGDVGIVLASLVMGPFAAVPAALGSTIADLLAGYVTYAPFTLVIKGAMGFILGKWLVAKRLSARNIALLILTAAFMVGAYFLTDTLLYGVEVKFYSNKVVVDTDFETSVKGLRAIGDGASVTRGLQQASANGISVARSILAK